MSSVAEILLGYVTLLLGKDNKHGFKDANIQTVESIKVLNIVRNLQLTGLKPNHAKHTVTNLMNSYALTVLKHNYLFTCSNSHDQEWMCSWHLIICTY